MFNFFFNKKRRFIKIHEKKAEAFLAKNYSVCESDIKFAMPLDNFDKSAVSNTIKSYLNYTNPKEPLTSSINASFVAKIMQYISSKNLSTAEVYKAANMDRRLFSKMLCTKDYQPSKDTVIALSIAIRLTLDEANDLLERAGYSLSHSIRRDVIIEYFFRECVYNLNDINNFLFYMGERVIGRNL